MRGILSGREQASSQFWRRSGASARRRLTVFKEASRPTERRSKFLGHPSHVPHCPADMVPNAEDNLRKTWWMPLVCFGLAFLLTKTDLLRLAEARTLDWRTKYRHYFQPPPDPRIVIARAGELGRLDKVLREKFYRKHEGTEREVLPEPTGEAWTDNYIRVDVPLDQVKTGLSHRRVESAQFGPKEIEKVAI